MAFKRKYKFNIIDYLYYAGRIRRIHKWHMPLVLCYFRLYPSISHNEIPGTDNTVVAAIIFIFRLDVGRNGDIFND